MTNEDFVFLSPGKLIDGDLELVLTDKMPADPVKNYVPQYSFEMRHPGESTPLGSIRLRICTEDKLRYAGHIGYEVVEEHRGHRFAARSCLLLLPLARSHGMKYVWLSAEPKNVPSQKTCAIIGAEYVETVRVPKEQELYRDGTRYVRRYRLDLSLGWP